MEVRGIAFSEKLDEGVVELIFHRPFFCVRFFVLHTFNAVCIWGLEKKSAKKWWRGLAILRFWCIVCVLPRNGVGAFGFG